MITKESILENWDNPQELRSYLGEHFFHLDFLSHPIARWDIVELGVVMFISIFQERIVKIEIYREGEVLHSVES